jgi:hypothetical protein
MGVVEVSCSGALVEVCGPGVGVVGVAGEVDDGAAQLFVHRPAVGHDFDFAGLSGRRGGTGQAGQRFGGRVAAAGVTDLGEQAGRPNGAGLGQRGEDRSVGVGGKLDGDLLVQCTDLFAQAGQGGDQGQGDFGPGGGLVAGGAARRVAQVGPEPVRLARWL